MIRDAIQLILVLRQLCPRVSLGRVILQRAQLLAIPARWKRGWHIVCEVQVLKRELDEGLEFVREGAFEGEAFEVDDEHRRHAGHCELFGGFAGFLAAWAVPEKGKSKERYEMFEGGIRTMRLRAP